MHYEFDACRKIMIRITTHMGLTRTLINISVNYNIHPPLLGVMPPDEHQEDVKNSIYTNLMANYAIHAARWTACLAGRDPEASVPDRWLNVAQKLVFTFSEEKRYHEEFEGYNEEVETSK